jgi:hypothetical protein
LFGVHSGGSKGASYIVGAANVNEGEVEVVVTEPLKSNTVDEGKDEVVVAEPLKSNTVDEGESAFGPLSRFWC